MPTWGEILEELNKTKPAPNLPPQFDAVRRKYLASYHAHVGRDVILYATAFTNPPPGAPPNVFSINEEDLHAFMEVVHGLKSPSLDLILHSPGGSAEAAEAIVLYLRSKFDNIRVVVPSLAMSAATMLACAANAIVMGKHSFLGPIDPQFYVNTPLGQRMVPAQAILEQFEQAVIECQDAAKLRAWLPMLNQYGPDLLVQCKNASVKSQELVETWLKAYMFAGDKAGGKKATAIADWLGGHQNFKSHARHIPREELRGHGLNVVNLEDNQKTQDLALSVFHAAAHTFGGGGAVKIVENHNGKAYIKSAGQQPVIMQLPGLGAVPAPGQPPKPAGTP